jgi:hypothetical protein
LGICCLGTVEQGPDRGRGGQASLDGTVRVWRLADGTPVGEPPTGHASGVEAVAAGALPDGTPVIISGVLPSAIHPRATLRTAPVRPWRSRRAARTV